MLRIQRKLWKLIIPHKPCKRNKLAPWQQNRNSAECRGCISLIDQHILHTKQYCQGFACHVRFSFIVTILHIYGGHTAERRSQHGWKGGGTCLPRIIALQGGHEQGLLITVGKRPDDIDLGSSSISTVREFIRFCDHRIRYGPLDG